MIHRLYLKALLSFEGVSLDFESGLVVLSGPSGAGKSVLMGSILSSFGMADAEASLCEVELDRPRALRSDAYELEDDLVIRSLKKDRTRYYLNEQNISKKNLKTLLSPALHYLSVRDQGGFESEALVALLDKVLMANDKAYKKLRKEYSKRYRHYREKVAELEQIQAQEKKLADLIEFATFEINKIKEIDPKIGEEEALLETKRQLSKIDKMNDALIRAEEVFALEGVIAEVFEVANRDAAYFWDTMNQLRSDFEEMHAQTQELEETDVESLLDRLEKLTELKRRYGSIEEAIAHRQAKEEELAGLSRIAEDKSMLENFLQLEFAELTVLAGRMTQARLGQASSLEASMATYLGRLKLPKVSFVFAQASLGESGVDSILMQLDRGTAATLSGGEHNRLRLALMVAVLESGTDADGIIVLDEIDANVSGDESIAIAEMISRLSAHYQVFAISHQPHLASKAKQHILIDKVAGKSFAKILDTEGKVREISRIIGGEMPNEEAVAFAKKLLSSQASA